MFVKWCIAFTSSYFDRAPRPTSSLFCHNQRQEAPHLQNSLILLSSKNLDIKLHYYSHFLFSFSNVLFYHVYVLFSCPVIVSVSLRCGTFLFRVVIALKQPQMAIMDSRNRDRTLGAVSTQTTLLGWIHRCFKKSAQVKATERDEEQQCWVSKKPRKNEFTGQLYPQTNQNVCFAAWRCLNQSEMWQISSTTHTLVTHDQQVQTQKRHQSTVKDAFAVSQVFS